MTALLTADLCAQALLAACGVYGKDPFVVAAAPRAGRTALVAAASAVRKITGVPVLVAARVFEVHQTSINRNERVGDAKFRRAVMAAWDAITVEEAPAQTGPTPAQPVADNKTPAPIAAVAAPSAPTGPFRVDHTSAIAAALARQRAAAAGQTVEVAGVAADKALIGATEPGGCVWPMGDPREPDYRSCQAAPLGGRLYCAEHLKKAGMKPVARVVTRVGRVAEPYVDREAG